MSTEAAKQTMLEMIGEGDQHDANDQVAYAAVIYLPQYQKRSNV